MNPQSRRGAYVCQSCLSSIARTVRPRAAPPRRFSPATSATLSATLSTAPQWHPGARSRRETASQAQTTVRDRTLYDRRPYSTTPTSYYDLQPAAKGVVRLPSRRLLSLSGPDAAKFLQGLVSQNVTPYSQSPFYTAFLDARGRVLWDVFVWTYRRQRGPGEDESLEWACYIEVDTNEVESLLRHLKKHKLRSKIKISPVPPDEMSVFAAWGHTQDQLQELHPDLSLSAILEDPRAPAFGFRFLSPNPTPEFPLLDLEQYTLRRHLHGIPEGQSEIQREASLPMEMNIDLSSGIDFKKGCYVGQELTIRTKHTGVVRKRILPVQLYRKGDAVPEEGQPAEFDARWAQTIEKGADIKILDEEGILKKGRAAGKYIAGIGNVGLALCRIEMMTNMRISAEGGSWRPGVEFAVQTRDGTGEEMVRIRAVVGEGFRERERAMWGGSKARTLTQPPQTS